jgi:hypothetical protein
MARRKPAGANVVQCSALCYPSHDCAPSGQACPAAETPCRPCHPTPSYRVPSRGPGRPSLHNPSVRQDYPDYPQSVPRLAHICAGTEHRAQLRLTMESRSREREQSEAGGRWRTGGAAASAGLGRYHSTQRWRHQRCRCDAMPHCASATTTPRGRPACGVRDGMPASE